MRAPQSPLIAPCGVSAAAAHTQLGPKAARPDPPPACEWAATRNRHGTSGHVSDPGARAGCLTTAGPALTTDAPRTVLKRRRCLGLHRRWPHRAPPLWRRGRAPAGPPVPPQTAGMGEPWTAQTGDSCPAESCFTSATVEARFLRVCEHAVPGRQPRGYRRSQRQHLPPQHLQPALQLCLRGQRHGLPGDGGWRFEESGRI